MIIILRQGLFNFPYTSQDFIIIFMSVMGTAYRIYLLHNHEKGKIKTIDYLGVTFMSAILTVGLYEMAITRGWSMSDFYLPFSTSIIVAKDITDFLFKSKEGRNFILSTFKSMIDNILSNFGYKKKDND